MPRVITTVTMSTPASDPNIGVGGTFDMDGSVSGTGSHAWDFDVHMQWDQGIASWADLDSDTGKGLSTTGTNPVTNHANANLTAVTVDGNIAGSYEVRIRTIDHNDGNNEDLSSTQTVTVVGGRRIMIIS